MKLQHYFPPLLVLAAAATLAAQQPAPLPVAELPAVTPVEKIPIITLPPEPVANEVKFDGIKVRDLPWHVTAVKAPESWAKNPAAKGKGIRIAVLDTGCQTDHPGLHGKVVAGYNAITKRTGLAEVKDGHNHGTHCAGIVHSIAPEADIIVVKVLSDRGSGSVDNIAHGIDWAVTEGKADVISLSLGGPSPDTYMPPAIKRAIAAGVIVVAAAGNDGGGPGRDTEGYPGRYPESISVAASDKNSKLATFSSWGPNVFTTDPGVSILSLLPGNNEGEMSGTSMACPCEAGKCASWIASNMVGKDANRAEKYRRAVLSASPFKERSNAIGYGLYTLDKITGTATVPPVPPVPGKPVSVVIEFKDLSLAKQAELFAGGVTTFRLEVGHAARPAAVMPGVAEIKEAPAPQPVPGTWVPPAQPWYPPVPQSVPLEMPGPACPDGVCPASPPRPADRTPLILPNFQPFGGRFRR